MVITQVEKYNVSCSKAAVMKQDELLSLLKAANLVIAFW